MAEDMSPVGYSGAPSYRNIGSTPIRLHSRPCTSDAVSRTREISAIVDGTWRLSCGTAADAALARSIFGAAAREFLSLTTHAHLRANRSNGA